MTDYWVEVDDLIPPAGAIRYVAKIYGGPERKCFGEYWGKSYEEAQQKAEARRRELQTDGKSDR